MRQVQAAHFRADQFSAPKLPLAAQPQEGPTPASVHLVLNPIGNRAGLVAELVRARCDSVGASLTVHETNRDDPGAGQARAALAAGADRVVVAGGDGTVRAVAKELAGSGVAIGIVPTGTANIFARNIGLRPRNLAACCDVAVGTRQARVDLGLASFDGPAGPEHHAFLVLAGVGRDAETVDGTRAGLKRRAGWLAYFESGLRHAVRPALPMRVGVDTTGLQSLLVWSVLVGNTPRIPGGVQVFPSAVIDDDLLDVLICHVNRPWQWFGVARAVIPRLDAPHRLVSRRQARTVEVETVEPLLLQLDGDVHGPITRATFRLRHQALDVCIPEGRP